MRTAIVSLFQGFIILSVGIYSEFVEVQVGGLVILVVGLCTASIITEIRKINNSGIDRKGDI